MLYLFIETVKKKLFYITNCHNQSIFNKLNKTEYGVQWIFRMTGICMTAWGLEFECIYYH